MIMETYDWKNLRHNADELPQEPWIVKGYQSDGYPSNSVCVGMTKVSFLGSYSTEEKALAAHPDLVAKDGSIIGGSEAIDDQIKDCSHLPDEPDIW